nr:MAG: hypothetical protein [Bacteriophage sp.]
MIYTDEQKKGIIIYSGKVANELLRQGYRITRVMPDKKNKVRTIFVFAVENNIEEALSLQSERTELFS